MKSKTAEILAMAPKRAKALFDKLNEIASIDANKDAPKDKAGKEKSNNYFQLQHYEEDLDWLGSLDKVFVADVKRAMKFTDDDLLYANRIPTL